LKHEKIKRNNNYCIFSAKSNITYEIEYQFINNAQIN